MRQVSQMDFIGAILVAGAVTTLVMALSGVEILSPGTTNLSSLYAVVMYAFLTRFSLLLYSYAVKHRSATNSGIDLLPFMLGVMVTLISTGQIVGKFGYYWPFLAGAPILLAIGSGLLYTLRTTTSFGTIVGFQILVGVGTGMGMHALLAIQVEFKDTPKLLAQAMSAASFAQFLGGTIGLGVAEPVFSTELGKNILRYAPEAPAAIIRESPTAIYTDLPAAQIPGVVQAYMQSLRVVFILGVPVAGLALFAAIFIKNIRIVKTPPVEKNNDKERGEELMEKRDA
ncbi:hypothetical protein B0H11DRAFT_1927161 [Mycena galericulata]|nr:hypothetical protein B0H11DRAFT_1927161 [Mycena galericulata]